MPRSDPLRSTKRGAMSENTSGGGEIAHQPFSLRTPHTIASRSSRVMERPFVSGRARTLTVLPEILNQLPADAGAGASGVFSTASGTGATVLTGGRPPAGVAGAVVVVPGVV